MSSEPVPRSCWCLAAEGVAALLVRVPGVIHGFLDHVDSVDVAGGALADVCAYLREMLACQRPDGPAATREPLRSGEGGDLSCDRDAH
jgi:hypothetical protein